MFLQPTNKGNSNSGFFSGEHYVHNPELLSTVCNESDMACKKMRQI